MTNNINRLIFAKGLTYIQFGLITVLFIAGPIIASCCNILMTIQGLGLMLGLISVYTVGLNSFSAFPTPRQGIRLVTTGPFRYIRNPMYLAVLLCVVPICIDKPTLIKVATVVMLLIVLFFKITVEEQLLEKQFSEYSSYKRKSWRIIPFVF